MKSKNYKDDVNFDYSLSLSDLILVDGWQANDIESVERILYENIELPLISVLAKMEHNGVLINGKRVNIPSYVVRPGDVVELTERVRGHLRVKAALQAAESRGFPEWLEVDTKAGKGVFKAYPLRAELPPTINEGLVVELYSR